MDVKKIVIIFSVFLMLSGGTVSVLKWLEIGPFAPVVEGEMQEEEEVVPDEPPVAIDVDQIFITIFAEDRVAATVMIKSKIEVIGKENEEMVTKLLPRLSDAFFKDLYVFIPRLVRGQKKLSAAILSDRMKATGDKVMGANVIHNVIIEEVSER